MRHYGTEILENEGRMTHATLLHDELNVTP